MDINKNASVRSTGSEGNNMNMAKSWAGKVAPPGK